MPQYFGSRGSQSIVAMTVVLVAACLVAADSIADADCKQCQRVKPDNEWCDSCGVGWVAGVRIPSYRLWETLDAHGHQIDPNSLRCETCRRALETDGFCTECKIGFVDGEAWFSRLTYLLARGERREPAEIDCPVCRDNARAHGWCPSCEIAMVGNVAISSRDAYGQIEHDLRVLDLAIQAAARCERCAAAIVTDTQCPVCRIRYEAGRPVGP